MPSIQVTDLKPGVKIAAPVHTPLGSTLFHKGKVVLPRDLDILRAFLIQSIEVEAVDTKNSSGLKEASKNTNQPQAGTHELEKQQVMEPFYTEYERMLTLIKGSFQSILASELPVLDLRVQLEALISQLKHYNILTFSPRNLNEYDYIYHNAILSSLTSYLIAQWTGMAQKDWMQVAFAGLLHDIGNARVDPKVLHSPLPLNAKEIEEIRMHTTYGYQMLRNSAAINEGVRLSALQHHEKVDGTGYPLRLTGDKMHSYSRIVAVADIFHAMTLTKRYRKAQSPYIVLEQLKAESFGKLDPGIVDTFIQKVTQFHNGARVRLNDERIGEIIFSERDHPTRPLISVQGQIINLILERSIYIKEIL
ncbi:HD-GYP domain-containing protein (c-di-GMP phosphodiesterase class II) [Paenibacillus shirakamiensis]|uniref:HD-GYP domain-containing protein (C-di-GMP phosphodiesterase class II) n=1 Tax=Paenibacillus shirakamiensis TaxID=1265935 RepID=A0ABS4JKZ9_9BACL|nr:HD-GYP domain-containing protein [Paenibacillus shirakamiensis]MBP2002368.1 HD-GYP domain-containing protein (c-di-GMP phosphodiesterase class II) [Paenibacillus shirakamiensis]